MNKTLLIFILLLVIAKYSFSQKVLREYYDYNKRYLKEEVQMGPMGLGNGFYRAYYRRGGYKETGFFINGTKTGLWSYYGEGASMPYEQWKFDNAGRKVMYKDWFQGGPNIGKLMEWKEWSDDELNDEGYPLVIKHVLYRDVNEQSFSVNYYMLYDLDIRRMLPLEKRYFKEYYPSGKVKHETLYDNKGGNIEDWYSEEGLLQRRLSKDKNGNIVSENNFIKKKVNEVNIMLGYKIDKANILFEDADPFSKKLSQIDEGSIIIINSKDQTSEIINMAFRKINYQGIYGFISFDERFLSPLKDEFYENGNIKHNVIINNEGGYTESWYSDNGALTDKITVDKTDNVVSSEISLWPESTKTDLHKFYYDYMKEQGQNDNLAEIFADCVIEKISTQKPYKAYVADRDVVLKSFRTKKFKSCIEDLFPYNNNENDEAKNYGRLGWKSYENGNIDSCIFYSKKALSLNNNIIWCKLNLGLCYLIKNDSINAKYYYNEALSDTDKLKGKFIKKYYVQEGINDIKKYLKNHQNLLGSEEIISLYTKRL